MLDQSKKLSYAIETVFHIAYTAGGRPIRSRDLAKWQGLPHRYLEQAMQKLVHSSVLRGIRGPNGGYVLARERRRITLGEIARIVCEPVNLEEKIDNNQRSTIYDSILEPIWNDLEGIVMNKLDQITVQDLCKEANRLGIKRRVDSKIDFSI